MKPLFGLLLVSSLGGCATAPLIPSAGDANASSLNAVTASVEARAQAPSTRGETGTPGETFATHLAATGMGRPTTSVEGHMAVMLDNRRVLIMGRWIRPDVLRAVPQRYSNDCAQAAIATTLDFLGISWGPSSNYDALMQTIPPTAWGTRLEDVVSALQEVHGLTVSPLRQASVDLLRQLVAVGKPVPVVLSLSATSMHYSVVMGTGSTADGQGVVLLKDPSLQDPGSWLALDEATFTAAWQNQNLRLPVIGWFAALLSHTNPDNYERAALDLGTSS